MTYAQMRIYEETRRKLAEIAAQTGENVIALVDRLANEELQRQGIEPKGKEDLKNV